MELVSYFKREADAICICFYLFATSAFIRVGHFGTQHFDYFLPTDRRLPEQR
jgi:hypothetical protein